MYILKDKQFIDFNLRPGCEVLTIMLNQLSMKLQLLKESKILKNNDFPRSKHSDVVFILLINVTTPTLVSILTFISTINAVLRSVEHGKTFHNFEA